MNLRLRLMQGQMVLLENVKSWEMSESGMNVVLVEDNNDKRRWFNKSYIAVVEEETK